MTRLRGDTAELRLETNGWIGLKIEDRICVQCGLREVKNVEHFVLRSSGMVEEREVLIKRMPEMTAGFEEQSVEERWH